MKNTETPFQKWWNKNKEGICHDMVHFLNNPANNLDTFRYKEQLEDQMMHLACQGWVAAETYNTGSCLWTGEH